MKIVVTHCSPDWDAITSVWIIKRFLQNWEHAKIVFVPAGERIKGSRANETQKTIEQIGEDEVIHVDTGLGPLDHHQTSEMSVCGASRTWDYVKQQKADAGERWLMKADAIERIVSIIVGIDHFQEVYWDNPSADYHEFSLLGILEGLKYQKPNEDEFYTLFGMECLDALLYDFENRAWAEKEISEKGKEFETRYGKALGIETMNDTVLKLAQKLGFSIVIRKDPRTGFVRIKTLPVHVGTKADNSPDFTLAYEKLSKMDPDATWYLHVSKKMLLNGTAKNPKMVPTRLTLSEIIEVIKQI
ncbi:MAG TPA: hypothetical protein VFQ63_01875 [Patescibacteria group bacterium]|nr:hypothetical protein [Patescibacteria group bacterium]